MSLIGLFGYNSGSDEGDIHDSGVIAPIRQNLNVDGIDADNEINVGENVNESSSSFTVDNVTVNGEQAKNQTDENYKYSDINNTSAPSSFEHSGYHKKYDITEVNGAPNQDTVDRVSEYVKLKLDKGFDLT